MSYGDRNIEQYICNYCKNWYIPKKRLVQKYCTPSCRVRACRERKGQKTIKKIKNQKPESQNSTKESFLGALGANLLTEVGKHALNNREGGINDQVSQLNFKIDALLSVFDKEIREIEVKQGGKVFILFEKYNSLTKVYTYWDDNGNKYFYNNGVYHLLNGSLL